VTVQPVPSTWGDSRIRKMWPFLLLILVIAIMPPLLDRWEAFYRGAGRDGPVVGMVGRMISYADKSIVLVLAALYIWSFGRLVPVLLHLIFSSLSCSVVGAELGLVFWLVYGGLASIGLPGLFWNPNPWSMFQAGLGVTLFLYWMLYLLFVRDYELHRDEPTKQVWVQFVPVFEASGFCRDSGREIDCADNVSRLRWFLAYAGLPGLVALAIPAVLPTVRPGGGPPLVAWPWLAGIVLGVLIVTATAWSRVSTRLHEFWRQLVSRQFHFGRTFDLDPNRIDPRANTRNLLIIVAFLLAASSLESVVGHSLMHRIIPPAFSICVMLGVVATLTVYLATRTWGERCVLGGTVLALIALAGTLRYEVECRDLAAWYPSAFHQIRDQIIPPPPDAPLRAGLVSLERFQDESLPDAPRLAWEKRDALLDRWARSFENSHGRNAENRRPILAVVTTSGGALRAALWTETVLRYLDDKISDFHRHVRLITGASGGMLGAARYVSAHTAQTPEAAHRPNAPDYLTPIAWHMAFRDVFPNSLLPWATYNRGDALEDAWTQYDRGLAQTFAQIKEKEEGGLIPSIVFSPMMVEDGRRLLISNQPLSDLSVNLGTALLGEDDFRPHSLTSPDRDSAHEDDRSPGIAQGHSGGDALAARQRSSRKKEPNNESHDSAAEDDPGEPGIASISAVELFGLLGDKGRQNVRLASAVRMSATFPYITSSVTLPTVPPRHLVDAGYYDNYGVNLAAAWIASHRDWIKQNTAGVLLVQIRAFRNERRLKLLSADVRKSSTNGEPNKTWARIEQVVHSVFRLILGAVNGVKSVLIPFEGFATARGSSMYFRNDEQILDLEAMFKAITGDDQFFRSVIFTCDTEQMDQDKQNVETLNWYMDPKEYARVQHNMEPYDPTRGTGRDRNAMRVKALEGWWRGRQGRTPAAAPARRRSREEPKHAVIPARWLPGRSPD
jgi:hypothetical protein